MKDLEIEQAKVFPPAALLSCLIFDLEFEFDDASVLLADVDLRRTILDPKRCLFPVLSLVPLLPLHLLL